LANKARQAWRQALVWDGAHPASAAFYRSFLARYKDPELQQMLSEIKVPAAATVENKVDLSRGREEKLGYAALNADRLPEAEGHFQAALKESSGSAGGLSGLGFISMKKEDFDSAVDYFEQAKSAAPASKQIADALNTARFWKNMKAAGGAQKDNRLDAAAELFQQALAMRPGNVDAAAGLAGAYMQQGKAAPAIPLYQEIVHQQPQNAQAWRGLVTARYRTGNYADALATAKQMPDGPRTLLGKDAEYWLFLPSFTARLAMNGNPPFTCRKPSKRPARKRPSCRLVFSSNSRASFSAPAKRSRPQLPSSGSRMPTPTMLTHGKAC
jgi:tetratricopeptide (TPR) repeat protein